MSQSASKRRIFSYDMLEVRPDGIVLPEANNSASAEGFFAWHAYYAGGEDQRRLAGIPQELTKKM
jgi:hypothetical protein